MRRRHDDHMVRENSADGGRPAAAYAALSVQSLTTLSTALTKTTENNIGPVAELARIGQAQRL
jgi:hypothetical protein